MLREIRIERLFNLYDYDIDLTNADGSSIKFITAPNGYGKTTILDFVDGLINQVYDKLFDIPFKTLELYYQESDLLYILSVHRSDEESESESSDIQENLAKHLDIFLFQIKGNGKNILGQCKITKSDDGNIVTDGLDGNLELFFSGRTCYYITDMRLLRRKTESAGDVSEMQTLDLNHYARKVKELLESPQRSKEFKDKIDAFKRIIDSFEFSNKHLEINERFGFRFVADDELKTKLSLNQLSSGERNIIIQFFELLFIAQDGTLVMIDEPELSLHMAWQMVYLKNLEEIVALRRIQCIVATHSPQIFNSLWSKSVDLFSISNGDGHATIS